MNHARLYDIMSGHAPGFTASIARLGLSILEPGYRLAVALRNQSFDAGLRKPVKLDRPVISVGNVTTGGTGKTPMVIELARRLIAQGQRPAVLLRGYMAGQDRVGSDEAEELSRELGPDVPVEAHPDRVEGARRVLEKCPQVTVFLLDDGFQHRQVHRDLDIVLIDATRPFGYDRLLPRGLLREPARNLCRADAIIVTRCDLVSADALAELDRRIEALAGHPPTAHAVQHWTGYRVDNTDLPADDLKNKQVVGCCAIGNPAAFRRMLEAAAGEMLKVHTFDDHHAYTAKEVRQILDDAKQRGAEAVIVTEKDWVKWRAVWDKVGHAPDWPRVVRPTLGVRMEDYAGVDKALDAQLLQTCRV